MQQFQHDEQPIRGIFEQLKQQPHRTLDYSFSTLEPMDTVSALQLCINDWGAEDCIRVNLQSMIFLNCDDYDFQIVIEVDDQGDCYTHGIFAYINDGDSL